MPLDTTSVILANVRKTIFVNQADDLFAKIKGVITKSAVFWQSWQKGNL